MTIGKLFLWIFLPLLLLGGFGFAMFMWWKSRKKAAAPNANNLGASAAPASPKVTPPAPPPAAPPAAKPAAAQAADTIKSLVSLVDTGVGLFGSISKAFGGG